MTAPSLGVVFRPQLPPERLRSVARAADDAGLDELWLWEDCFLEGGVSTATAALAWTERIRVGIGLLPVPLRNVALAAMEAATLARLFPGRLELAVGHGVQEWMGQVGARVQSPMTLLREYTTALRALLAGQRVTTDGRYVHLDGVALDWPPTQAPRLMIGAVGPRTVALSGELADGTLLTAGTTPDALRRTRGRLDEARAAVAISGAHTVTVYLIAVSGPQAEQRLAAELRAWSLDGNEDVGIAGGPEQLAEGISRWGAAGADSVVLQPSADEPDLEAFIALLGAEVRPLLPG
jgi:alkanesulfonate monooxygenase SsuD/methylene tetrahydromethanopterin reductase-like flavin-dependent oxidoreductase (luciferase family)